MNETSTVRLRQPKALYLLFFVQMWECFSYYGMRALLVLYLIEGLSLSEFQAIGIFSIYCAVVELGGILGGHIADRYLGLRHAIIIGGWLIAAGHLSLMLGTQVDGLYFSLGLIALGTSLFSTNISSLLGFFYGQEDPRRDRGYTLFYMGINLGGLLATISCAWIAEWYGWDYGFGLAALGMIVGNIVLVSCLRLLEDKGQYILTQSNAWKSVLYLLGLMVGLFIMIKYSTQLLSTVPLICIAIIGYALNLFYKSGKVTVKEIGVKAIFLLTMALFFSAEEQVATTILIFSDRFTTGMIGGLQIPPSVLLSINPLIIIGGGTLIMMLCEVLNLKGSRRIAVGCLLAASAFIILSVTVLGLAVDQYVSMMPLVLAAILVSLGELFVAPAVYSYFSESTPQELQGITMGLIPIGYSLASVFNGLISQIMVSGDELGKLESLETYGTGFGIIAAVLIGMSCVLILFKNITREEVYGTT
jgi:POT family proton-dependent oligopeptide transporter